MNFNIFNTASDFFEHPALSFWSRFGTRTVQRLKLKEGDKILDVCCGSGSSAIPAAQQVGASGDVLAIDISEKLLDLGRKKANALNLSNIHFQHDDLQKLNLQERRFDAIICVFGIFFVEDMGSAIKQLWKALKPNGTLAITTWDKNAFNPAEKIFLSAVADERPDLAEDTGPWDRVSTVKQVKFLFESSGIVPSSVDLEPGNHPLRTPDDWWAIVLGTAHRATLEQLDSAAQERVKQKTLAELRDQNVKKVSTNVIYANARA